MNRIKLLRTEKHLSQGEVGNIIGVSSQALGLYEKEKRGLSPEQILKLSDFFNVSTDYLLGKSDIRNSKQQEDPLGLAKIGFNLKDYKPPTEEQKQQLEELIKVILKDNKNNN